MKQFFFHQPLLLGLVALLPGYLPQVQSECVLIQLVIDESGSMEKEQEFLKLNAMPQVIDDLRIKYGQDVYVCSWGFGYTNRGK